MTQLDQTAMDRRGFMHRTQMSEAGAPTRLAPGAGFARPAPVMIDALGAPRREATRRPEDRGPDFPGKFDGDTLFYDCFRMTDGRVMLLGPALFNLKPLIEAMEVRALPSKRTCPVSVSEMERHTRVIVDAPADAGELLLRTGSGETRIAIQENQANAFAGRRVLFTLSKNNHLNWIADWIAFARDHHGADAVLFYDNGSTLYGHDELLDTIMGVGGIAAARVVDWNFPYGPQGTAQGLWDSDFCQHGAWEHARWRFLPLARSAQNADVDELVVSTKGKSVFAAAEADPFGIVSYRGRWVIGTGETAIDAASDARTHGDYDTVLRAQKALKFKLLPFDAAACPPKWTIVPGKCPPGAQWGVHAIFGWLPSRRVSRTISYRHFREITDNWKYSRTDRPLFDAELHEHDALLARYFG